MGFRQNTWLQAFWFKAGFMFSFFVCVSEVLHPVFWWLLYCELLIISLKHLSLFALLSCVLNISEETNRTQQSKQRPGSVRQTSQAVWYSHMFHITNQQASAPHHTGGNVSESRPLNTEYLHCVRLQYDLC